MIHKKLILVLAFSLSLLFVNSANAGVNLLSFSIQDSYLSGGKLNVQSDKDKPFTANFRLSRSGNLYNTVKVYLVYKENTTITVIGEAKWKYNGDWLIGDPYLWESTIDGILPKGKKNGSIYLYFQSFEGDTPGGITESMTNYNIYVFNNPVTPPVDPNNPPVINPPVNPPIKDSRYIIPTVNGSPYFSDNTKNIVYNGTFHLDIIRGELTLYNGIQVIWSTEGRADRTGWNALFESNGLITRKNPLGGRGGTIIENNTPEYKNVIWKLGEDGNLASYANSSVGPNGEVTLGEKIYESGTTGGVIATKPWFLKV